MLARTTFETNFRSAETLLKIHRLLASDHGPQIAHELLNDVRSLLGATADEELILLLNDLFLGVVRENADVRVAFFREASLSLLLRQAVVVACSAMDLYYPALLHQHLPTVIEVKQRRFVPDSGDVRGFFGDFRLSLEDHLRIAEDPNPAQALADFIFRHFERKTFSNIRAVTVSLQLLGVERPWRAIANRIGLPDNTLRQQVQRVIARRNNIVHRGDRPVDRPEGEPEAIDYAWTNSHIQAIQNVALASDHLAAEAVGLLREAF
jgi:hypothetical protein